MQYGYIIKITGQNIYNEAQLSISTHSYRIGTDIEADMRFRKDLFFEEFDLFFIDQENQWSVSCSDNIYIDCGDVKKLATKQLKHGDVFSVRYQESGNELFRIEFIFDFDNEEKDYTRVVDIRRAVNIVVGEDQNADLNMSGKYVNKGCFELVRRSEQEYDLIIRRPGYGIYHNGIAEDDTVVVNDGDFLSLANYSFYLRDGFIYTSKAVTVTGLEYHDLDAHDEYPKFNRNTRLKSGINEDEIEILDPPSKPKKPARNVLLQLLPALGMVALIVIVRGFIGNNANSGFVIFSICSMALGIVTSIASMLIESKKYKKETAERAEKYNAYIDQKKDQISQYRSDELSRLKNIHIAPQQELDNIAGFSGDIFDKVIGDDDFLHIRLGYGKIEAKRKVSYKKQERFESDDELASLPELISDEFRYIENAPITLDILNNNTIGVVGSSDDRYFFAKSLLLDIIARHYYKDVRVFFMISESEAEKYADWLKWLPHVFDENTGTRNIVYSTDSKSSVFERLYVEFGKRFAEKKGSNDP